MSHPNYSSPIVMALEDGEPISTILHTLCSHAYSFATLLERNGKQDKANKLRTIAALLQETEVRIMRVEFHDNG